MKKAQKRQKLLTFLFQNNGSIILKNKEEEEIFRKTAEEYCLDVPERDETGYEGSEPVYPVYVTFRQAEIIPGLMDQIAFLGYERLDKASNLKELPIYG